MKQHPIKNHGGLVAVGVDADLFDKVAEKLATSGDLEKALDFGFWSMVDFSTSMHFVLWPRPLQQVCEVLKGRFSSALNNLQ